MTYKNYKSLTINEVIETLQTICEEYSDFLTSDCEEEVMEKFYNYYTNITLAGMTKNEAYTFHDFLCNLFNIEVLKVQNK